MLTIGVQWIKSSEVAANTCSSPQYIKYFPLIFLITCFPLTTSVRIEPDLQPRLKNFPSNALAKAGPCFVQSFRLREVATARRGTWRFHWVYIITYNPSSVTAIRGSSQPPGHSNSFCESLSGQNTGVFSRWKCVPSVEVA